MTDDDRPHRRALDVLLWPARVVAVALWVLGVQPKRVPDLRRLSRVGDFRRLQSGASFWVDRHFERVDANVAWLDRAGQRVLDRCETRFTRSGFTPGPPSVWCTRDVTGVYGADGNLPDILAELRAALGRVGWTIPDDRADFGKSQWEPVLWPFRLSDEAPGPPAGLHTIPSGQPEMGIGWTSRGQPPAIRTTMGNDPEPPIATAVYQPVEVAGTGVDRLASQVLARHQHAIAIRIGILYYYNGNANAEPGRLRKRLLPVW